MIKENNEISSENILPVNNQPYILWFYRLALIIIVLFSIFLRYEDFSVWEKQKENFQYEGEYQMANFDSYYYLNIAKELKEGNYDGLQENRRVPNGMKSPFIPPLLSVFAATISGITAIPFSTVAIFLPIFLASLLAPLIFLICIRLNFNRISALTAAFFSITSLMYVIRTRVGVFDTDCLNVVLILLNSYLFFRFAELNNNNNNNKRYKYLALGVLSTLFSYAWWNTANSIVILSALAPLFIAIIFFFKTKKPLLKYGLLTVIVLVSFYFIGNQVQSFFSLLFSNTQNTFPKNISVTELSSVTLDYFIQKTTNNKFISILMLIGFISLLWKLKLKSLFFIIPIILAIIPFFAGNRFVIFSAPILALGIGYFVQLLFDFKKIIKPKFAYISALAIIIIGFFSSYTKITNKYEKAAAYENKALLKAIDENTPKGSNIWAEWDLGYQIQYYLNRGTYADGEFSDGEIYFYNAFPYAVDNLTVSANYMRFYNKHGVKGMKTLYKSLSGVERTFKFLKIVLSLTPSEAEEWLIEKEGSLSNATDLVSPKQWVSFLFPKQSDDIYFFIHYKMTQTASWFKQGNSDLKTGKTIGLPLFLSLTNLKEQNNQIKNNQISVNPNTGIANFQNQKRYFKSLSTFNGIETTTKTFKKSMPKDGFVFQWNKKIGFGAAMSTEIANTTLVKLYLLQEKSSHFQPVSLNTPQYQIWKITGNAYEVKTNETKKL